MYTLLGEQVFHFQKYSPPIFSESDSDWRTATYVFHGWEIRIEKNFARGLKCTCIQDRGQRFSRYGPTKAGK